MQADAVHTYGASTNDEVDLALICMSLPHEADPGNATAAMRSRLS